MNFGNFNEEKMCKVGKNVGFGHQEAEIAT
jgi:hypothetical protein